MKSDSFLLSETLTMYENDSSATLTGSALAI